MKSLIIIFAVLIVGILFIAIWDYTSNPPIDQNNYNEISWRLPLDKEIKNVSDSFIQSNIHLCSSYFIKKIEGEKFLIACDSGDGSWTYYTAYIGKHRVFRTPREFTSSLNPPDIIVEHPAHDPLEKKSTAPEKTGSSRETIAR